MIHHLLHASPSFVPSGHFPRHPPNTIGSRTARLLPGCIRHVRETKTRRDTAKLEKTGGNCRSHRIKQPKEPQSDTAEAPSTARIIVSLVRARRKERRHGHHINLALGVLGYWRGVTYVSLRLINAHNAHNAHASKRDPLASASAKSQHKMSAAVDKSRTRPSAKTLTLSGSRPSLRGRPQNLARG